MIETRQHTLGVADLTQAEAQAVGDWVTEIARALTAVATAGTCTRSCSATTSSTFTNMSRHAAGAPREFWGIRVDPWPAAPRGVRSRVADPASPYSGKGLRPR